MAEQKQNTNGLIEWKVTGNLLEQFQNAKHKQKFESPAFETIDGTIWRIWFCPSSDISPDHCSIYLQCVKLNGAKQRMGVCCSFDIMELDWGYDGAHTFKNDGDMRRLCKAFKTEKLDYLEIMSIECRVSEAMDVSDANTYFEWKVNHHWMQKWKNTQYKYWFCSPMFNAIGAEWQLRIYPNGYNWMSNGDAELYIYCTDI
eukprot:119725_1